MFSRAQEASNVAAAAQTLAGSYRLDSAHSFLMFTVVHLQVARYRASVDDLDARLIADDDGVRFEGSARVESVSIKPQMFRDHVVYGPEFLDARTFPEIAFRSTVVQLHEAGTAAVRGELTMKGVTRPITAIGTCEGPFEDTQGSTRAALELNAVIDRRDWGIGWQAVLPNGGDVLGYEVELNAQLALVRDEA
jgi:polyisoprenoid-binding protein YceI